MTQNTSNDELQIIDTIKNYIQERGGDYSSWSIGICQDIPDIVSVLYNANNKHWVYYKIPSLNIAKKVLNQCVNQLGMNTNHSAPCQDEGPCNVYAYRR